MHRPQVITWFKAYCALMIVVYTLVAVLGGVMIANPDALIDPDAGAGSSVPTSQDEAMIMGVIYLGLGVVLGIAFVVPFLLPRRFGSWIYDLVMICLGLTSVCCMPVTIPLLIFWIKEDTRLWFKNAQTAAYDRDPMRPY